MRVRPSRHQKRTNKTKYRQQKAEKKPQASEVPPEEQHPTEDENCQLREMVSFDDGHGLLLETIFSPKNRAPLSFIVCDKGRVANHAFFKIPDGDGGEIKLIPPRDPNGLVAKGVVLLPAGAEPYGSQKCLVDEICSFVHRYADVPPFWERLIAHYTLMTFVYDAFTAIPYLRFLGESQTGKTRLLQISANLSFKAILAGGATTVSPMFRLIDVYHGTFVIDEADYKDSELWSDIVKVLNTGYMRGLPILRSDKVGGEYEPRAFDPFGPKILSTRQRFADHALETRCITLETREGRVRSDIRRQMPKEFFEEARQLRSKMLMWRLHNRAKIQPDETPLLSLEPRLTQIGTPLYSISIDPQFQRELLEFLKSNADAQRAERPQAVIAEAISRLAGGNGGARLAVKAVAGTAMDIATAWGVETEFTAKRVGSIVRSFGFESHRAGDGYHFSISAAKLQELRERYQTK